MHLRIRGRLARVLVAGALLLPLGLAACGDDGSNDPNGTIKLRVFWWGGEARAKLTEDALALYSSRHPNVTFEKTWQANQGYFEKLATLTAGDDAPDIFQIDDNYLSEYAARGVTMDLGPYRESGKLNVTKFPESLVKYGEVDDKFVGVAIGENTPGLVYNKTKLKAAGVPEPTIGMSWTEFIDWAEKAGKATKIPGTMDPSGDYKAFWIWLRQQGKDLYRDGGLGFTAADLTGWFEMWAGARARAGATPTKDVIHEGNSTSITKQLVLTDKALTSWVWVNQMPEMKKNTKDELGVIAYPGDPSGQWARAAMYFSVFRGSEHADIAVDVIDFLANDPAAGAILGTERGLPPNLDVRQTVAATVTDPAMQQSIEVENELAKTFGPAPTVPPKGHSTVRSELVTAAESVIFGRSTPAAAAEQYIAAAKAAIG